MSTLAGVWAALYCGVALLIPTLPAFAATNDLFVYNPAVATKLVNQASAERRHLTARGKHGKGNRQRIAQLAIAYAQQVEATESLGMVKQRDTMGRDFERLFYDSGWRLGAMAKNGDAQAMATLALLHRHGWVVPQDEARNCAYSLAAAKANHPYGLFNSARCLATYQPDEARRMMEKAADAGHPLAQEILGRNCLEGETKDLTCAARWIGKAAARKRVSAMSLMGWMRATGTGVAQDLQKARDWYTAAAAEGDAPAQNNLGELWELGQGGPQDVFQAFEWYQLAAETGFGPAQFNLGRMYLGVKGISADLEQARIWLMKADGQGVPRAHELLDVALNTATSAAAAASRQPSGNDH